MFLKTDCILCLGRRGSGKSFLAKIIQRIYPRKVIFDTLEEYGDTDGIVVRSFDAFSKQIVTLAGLSRFTLIFKFSVESSDHALEFDQALRCLYYFEDIQIVIEEVQNFSSPHFLPHWLRQCLLTGRHRGISLLFTTQRPGELNKTILSQCAHIFAGPLHEKNDLNYVSSFLGVATARLTHLPPRRFLYFRPGEKLLMVKNDLKA